MRGKPYGIRTDAHKKGITPADAGKTAGFHAFSCGCADHPRGCGENIISVTNTTKGRGSPPRMRGKLCNLAGFGVGGGITPADAGKTRTLHEKRPTPKDHPRGCGENLCDNRGAKGYCGSPPRMRGKPCLASSIRRSRSDHPRGCGENHYPRVWAVLMGGSPPRMRGKLVGSVFNDGVYRITPADAGKTSTPRTASICSVDHPRGCGENAVVATAQPHGKGSPPRMRGKQCLQCSPVSGIRITPADAGKTKPRRNAADGNGDHPRGCGENGGGGIPLGVAPGSPPRMRGKL